MSAPRVVVIGAGVAGLATAAVLAERGADVLVLVTEWKEFRAPDLPYLAEQLASKAVFDGRNIYDPEAFAAAGLAWMAGVGWQLQQAQVWPLKQALGVGALALAVAEVERISLSLGRKRRRSIRITFVPLVDCFIILLIFFMLQSSFVVPHGVDLKGEKKEALQAGSTKEESSLIYIELHKDGSLWLDGARESLVARDPLPGDSDTDVAIVGAGFTGLWTALALLEREPTMRVVVIDRHHVGYGASGRNGGWASALFAGSRDRMARLGGPGAVLAHHRAMVDAISDIERMQIVSGALHELKMHFEAPPSEAVTSLDTTNVVVLDSSSFRFLTTGKSGTIVTTEYLDGNTQGFYLEFSLFSKLFDTGLGNTISIGIQDSTLTYQYLFVFVKISRHKLFLYLF